MIIPTVRCSRLRDALAFYTGTLDFRLVGLGSGLDDPGYAVLDRAGSELHLSSHGGDGAAGQAVAILHDDVDTLFAQFVARGLKPSADQESPVHQGPLDQTWGTREFYVDDPDGNTLRLIQR